MYGERIIYSGRGWREIAHLLLTQISELGILRKEAVARMDALWGKKKGNKDSLYIKKTANVCLCVYWGVRVCVYIENFSNTHFCSGTKREIHDMVHTQVALRWRRRANVVCFISLVEEELREVRLREREEGWEDEEYREKEAGLCRR